MNTKEKIIVGAMVGLVVLRILRYSKPRIFYVKELSGGFNAKTIPPIGIFIREDQKDNAALKAHELTHWEQYRKYGLLGFYLLYGHYHQTHGYDHNPMETEARFNETEFCKNNYTYCVRNGLAKTVNNKNFRV